jgi:1-acyl-sn-glycerol-3-phosphate acyltransferase
MYLFLRTLSSLYLRIFHRVDIRNAGRIPATGGIVICANHTSYFDSMLLALCTPRRIRFVILRSFYEHPLLGYFIRSCGAIPVGQRGGDREALREAAEALRAGEAVAVFPEGRLSRTGVPGPARPGAALLAAEAGVPLIPVTISGAFFVYPKGRRLPRPGRKIVVTVHPPVRPDPQQGRERGHLAELTGRVMGRIEKRMKGYLRKTGRGGNGQA